MRVVQVLTTVTWHVHPRLGADGGQPDGRNRLTCALRLIWLIPAAIVTAIIGLIGGICWFIAFFAVLFTGRWPAGLLAWVMKSMRASLRLNAYAFLLTDEYPPMSFD